MGGENGRWRPSRHARGDWANGRVCGHVGTATACSFPRLGPTENWSTKPVVGWRSAS